jgi:Ni,Fe-hydrogenase III large subunit
MTADAIIRTASTVPCRPWARHVLPPAQWQAMAAALPAAPELQLVAMWADVQSVHALFRDTQAGAFLPASVPAAAGYAALSPHRPAAAWFERAIRDLWGHEAEGAADTRPWLDHGAWPEAPPLGARPLPRPPGHVPPAFREPPGTGHDQVPLGPLPPDIGDAGQFRAFARGEAVLRLESRLGYLHRGIPALMRGKSPRAASRFAARLAGAATVAHGLAFARAAELASDAAAPPRAIALRGALAEAERAAIHLADIDALCRAAGAPLAAALCQRHREALLQASEAAFGHRLLMDVVVPGGLATDIAPEGPAALRAAATALGRDLPDLAALCRGLMARLDGIARVPAALAARIAPGGPPGRAMATPATAPDLRRVPGYRPYQDLNVALATESAGDAAARLAVRLAELRESCRLLGTLLADLPAGPVVATLPLVSGEGIGWAEGPRGDAWAWLRLEGGQIAAAFLRDPAWLHLPLLEAAMEGTDLSDFAIAQASFDLALPGMDL